METAEQTMEKPPIEKEVVSKNFSTVSKMDISKTNNSTLNSFTDTQIVAIDGVSGSGKSSTAQKVATLLGYNYIDTGAMYRALTYLCLEQQITLANISAIESIAQEMQCTLKENQQESQQDSQHLLFNGRSLESEIRSLHVSQNVSDYCAIPTVRRLLVEKQRALGRSGFSVVDGRDIGTVVFPNSKHKFFFWAAPEIRAHRRKAQLDKLGKPANYEEILNNLKERDYKDTHRSEGPLRQAEDAIKIDTSTCSFEEQVSLILTHIRNYP
jgi:CMP/dCMP kinase